MYFLLYKHTADGVFDNFPKISDHSPKLSKDFPKLFRRPDKRSWTFSENFRKSPSKISEDFQRLLKTFEEDPKMFWWYTNEYKYNWYQWNRRYLHMWGYRIVFYEFVTTRYTTDFYIIKWETSQMVMQKFGMSDWKGLVELLQFCLCFLPLCSIVSEIRKHGSCQFYHWTVTIWILNIIGTVSYKGQPCSGH